MCNAKVGSTYADVDPGIYTFNGVYQIQNNASGKVLNNLGSTTNGSPIEQWTTASSSNLDWTFIATGNGYYQINSSKSGKDAVVQSVRFHGQWRGDSPVGPLAPRVTINGHQC